MKKIKELLLRETKSTVLADWLNNSAWILILLNTVVGLMNYE